MFCESSQWIIKTENDIQNLLKDAADVKREVSSPSTFSVELNS